MDVERQQGIMKQLNLFEQVGSVIRPVDFGEAGSGSETNEEQQAFTAMGQQRALTYVKRLKETAVYVERMPGGVRGGGREASPYSMCARHDVNLEGASPLQAVVVGTVS